MELAIILHHPQNDLHRNGTVKNFVHSLIESGKFAHRNKSDLEYFAYLRTHIRLRNMRRKLKDEKAEQGASQRHLAKMAQIIQSNAPSKSKKFDQDLSKITHYFSTGDTDELIMETN